MRKHKQVGVQHSEQVKQKVKQIEEAYYSRALDAARRCKPLEGASAGLQALGTYMYLTKISPANDRAAMRRNSYRNVGAEERPLTAA